MKALYFINCSIKNPIYTSVYLVTGNTVMHMKPAIHKLGVPKELQTPTNGNKINRLACGYAISHFILYVSLQFNTEIKQKQVTRTEYQPNQVNKAGKWHLLHNVY